MKPLWNERKNVCKEWGKNSRNSEKKKQNLENETNYYLFLFFFKRENFGDLKSEKMNREILGKSQKYLNACFVWAWTYKMRNIRN